MTRIEAIHHLATEVIPAVFKAEDKLRPQLQQILKEHEDDPTTAAELCTLMPSLPKSSVTPPTKN